MRMKLLKIALAILFVFLVLECKSANGCPNCRDATKATPGASSESQFREAQAFNRSIYVMAGMPFVLLGGFSLAFYRMSRSNPSSPN
jgi:hypothetical protein